MCSLPTYLVVPWSFASTISSVSSLTIIKLSRSIGFSCSVRFCLVLTFCCSCSLGYPPSSSLPATMSLINSATHQSSSKHQLTQQPSRNRRCPSKQVLLLHHQMPMPLSDDWVLFSQEMTTEKHSSVRRTKLRANVRSASARRQRVLSPDSPEHETKAATAEMNVTQRLRKPYRPSTCLNHMSARNCTPACSDVRPPPPPPKAPSPPRLPTPDLSDVEDDDLWTCCRFSESNSSNESSQTSADTWDEMSESSHLVSRPALKADMRFL